MCVHVLCAQLCAREWGRTQASCENRPRGCKGRGIVKCSIVEEYQKEASRRQTLCSSSDSHTPQVQQQKPSRKEVSFLPVAPLDSTHSSLFCHRLFTHILPSLLILHYSRRLPPLPFLCHKARGWASFPKQGVGGSILPRIPVLL